MRISDCSSDVCSSDLEDVGSQPGTADGYALGAEKFAKMILTNEGVDTSLTELERIGRADLKRNQDALKAACANYAAGMTIADCMKKINSDKPEGGPVAEARRQPPVLSAFLAATDTLPLPGPPPPQATEPP